MMSFIRNMRLICNLINLIKQLSAKSPLLPALKAPVKNVFKAFRMVSFHTIKQQTLRFLATR